MVNYQELFKKSPALFLLLKPDHNFTIIDASDAYLEATLTKREEISGRALFTVFPDNPEEINATGVNNLRNSLNAVIQNKKEHKMAAQKYDVPLPGGQGFEEKYWLPVNTPFLNALGEVEYIIHQAEDVTEKYILEKKKKSADAEVEQQSRLILENNTRINEILNALLRYTTMDFSEKLSISEKGDELDAISVGLNSLIDELENHTQLLKQVNAELEYSNKELDSFSYSVSHDLRAPLRAISGYAQIILEDYAGRLEEEGRNCIQTIIKNAVKMSALIDDLLTFSRVGKQNMTKIPLNMRSLVDNVMRELLSTYKGNDVTWVIKDLANAEGDGSMMNQVVTNLISNALKYSGKKDKPVIEIGSYTENNKLIYYVKDNGAGFDMKYYNKLFGVFQRLHSATEFEGTGVGLALVHRIIRKHQGEVWAESEPEKGATFFFSLPV